RVGWLRPLGRLARLTLPAADDEAAADRVVLLLAQRLAIRRRCGEAHAVRMPGQALGTQQQKLRLLVEFDLVPAEQPDAAAPADALQSRLDAVGIDRLGVAALETHEHRAVGPVAEAGQGERAVKTHRHLLGCRQQPVALQAQGELVRGAHGPHGVRAGRPDADLENIEDAQRHFWKTSSRALRPSPADPILKKWGDYRSNARGAPARFLMGTSTPVFSLCP